MDRSRIKLFYNTIKFLKPIQVYFRLFYFFRNRFFKKSYSKELPKGEYFITWKDFILNSNSYLENNKFCFLNIEKDFGSKIDWNFEDYGKLWSFNLNYFDFLNQKKISVEKGIDLIHNYILQDKSIIDGKASYTISLRGINWVKFLSKNNIQNTKINQTLYNHYQILHHNPEYHLLGNHLFENGFSLLFGAYYFKDEKFYKKAVKILKTELEEEILKDGGHFELSPMYHQTMLFRVLDCIQLLNFNDWKKDDLILILKNKASKMLSWLSEVTFKNGNIPMVNDSTFNIAPSTKELFNYAQNLNLPIHKIELSDSGYRMFKYNNFELFVDIGNVGSSYQPAHVHSDTFNFLLHINGAPIFTDTGISTYEKNELRQKERSTASHNTVIINEQEQTEVWGGFRVANRAKIINLNESSKFIEATHDGYKNLGVYHSRRFDIQENEISIFDMFNESIKVKKVAHFHFHPKIKEIDIKGDKVTLKKENIEIQFLSNLISIQKENYMYSLGFNKTIKSTKIIVEFKDTLKTTISL